MLEYMCMPQLHFYLPKELAEQVKKNAKRQGKTASAYVAEIVKEKLGPKGWSPGFLDWLERKPVVDDSFVEPSDDDLLPLREVNLDEEITTR